MSAIASLKPSPTSEPVIPAKTWSALPVAAVALCTAVLSAAAVWWCWRQGWTLYYGDAEAHLNIARRILDSRTPGYGQFGTWSLLIPHLAMMPLVARDDLWRTGLGGAIPPAIFFILGVTFLFAAVRRMFACAAAGSTAAALYALNPNALYLQSIPMTEAMFFGELAALLYFTVRFRDTSSPWSAAGAGIAAFLGALTRYECWFLIPFTAAYFLFAARRRRVRATFVFGAIACLGPLVWLAYNRLVFGNMWEFYSGPASTFAIQHGFSYPGKQDWKLAAIYFGWAARACAGAPLFFLGAAGLLAALWKRAWWPVVLLALPGAFYVWSIHSSDTPIFLPNLWPHSYYNTRYGLALLPLIALGGSAVVALASGIKSRFRPALVSSLAVIAVAVSPWFLAPRPESCITWKESQANSVARRAWTHKAAQFFEAHYHPGDGIITSFGDYTGVFREAGIPLRATLTGDNGALWQSAVLRPDLYLWEQWAMVMGGDPVQTAVNRARRRGPHYNLARQIIVKGAPVIEIYERSTAPSNLYQPSNEDYIPESPRREK
ncbi:MAG TPA: glycosyltransferase family 39 protein [Bryobacteraceae bacterium]|nr:glycosyltransferase family 39 protein [Bryobacteraceae bacterium]